MRFFGKAIEVYNQGLQKFPTNLDLAYNKLVLTQLLSHTNTNHRGRARALLEIATHPALVDQLPIPISDALQQALDAHQYALNLDQDNPDTLFNTAQVLTTIAELRAENGADHDALTLLQQALELQTRCLAIQEMKLEESLQQMIDLESQSHSDGTETVDNSQVLNMDHRSTGNATNTEDQWFSIVEPITKDTLVDTILAQLATLTTFCSILTSLTISNSPNGLAWIEEFSSKLFNEKLPFLLDDADSERLQEVALTRANFLSHLLAAGYRLGSIDASTYKKERDEAFRSPELKVDTSYAALTANASSLIAFNSALAERDQSPSTVQASQRWNAISTAISNLAAASKMSDPIPEEIAETHFARGNASLLQYQLGQPPISYQPAVSNSTQLLKNADVFYRNASKLFQSEKQKAISHFRAGIVQALQTGSNLLESIQKSAQDKDQDWIEAQLQEMIDEGLILRDG